MISACHLCPRECGVPRGEEGAGVCRSGETARVARAALHFWEEPPISGQRGSGVVFFTGCTLGCIYCQNGQISHGPVRGRKVTPEELSKIFFDLVAQDRSKLSQIRRFLNYYLPTTLKLLNAYDRMDQAGVEGANIDGTMGKIEAMLDQICTAFDKQLDALFANEALDISTDITVLEQMLAREGLGGTQLGQVE